MRMLATALKTAEVEKGGELAPDDALAVVAREVKKRQQTADEFEKAGRLDRAEAERREAEMLKGWLPEELPDSELAALVDAAIAETGASTPQEMGKVMAALMPKVKGRADGRKVSELVKKGLVG